MSVPEKRDRGWSHEQGFHSVAYRHYIFVLIDGGAMHELGVGKAINLKRTLRQRTQPFQILRCELCASPSRSQSRHGVEVFQVNQAAHCFVMIATNKNFP